jgi:hypothetical protein
MLERRPKNSDLSSLKTQLLENSLDLVLRHGIAERDLQLWIKQALLEAVSDKPDIHVVYNACYGGFGLSDHFKKFCEDQSINITNTHFYEHTINEKSKNEKKSRNSLDIYRDRVQIASVIPKYAEAVRRDHPVIPLLLSAHDAAEKAISQAKQIVEYERCISAIPVNLATIRAWLDAVDPSGARENADINTAYSMGEWTLTHRGRLSSYDMWSFNKNQAREFLDKLDVAALINRYEEKLTNALSQTSWTDLDVVVRNEAISYAKNENIIKEKKDQITRGIAFMDAFMKGDVHNAWCNQSAFSRRAMAFAQTLFEQNRTAFNLLVPANDNGIKNQSSKSSPWDLVIVGLLCASGRYSQLALTTVKPHVGFDISEYDGMERVQYT